MTKIRLSKMFGGFEMEELEVIKKFREYGFSENIRGFKGGIEIFNGKMSVCLLFGDIIGINYTYTPYINELVVKIKGADSVIIISK